MAEFTIPVQVDAPTLWRLSERADKAGVTVAELVASIATESLQPPPASRVCATRVEMDVAIVEMHHEGHDNAEIARALGTSRELVRRRLTERGLKSAGRNQRKVLL